MPTAKLLTKPQVIEIIGSTLRIAHPDISGYTRTEMISPLTAGGTALSVSDNNNLADDDWFVLGEAGDAKAEECDVNGAVTRGTSLTITNTTKFSHDISTPLTKIYERGIRIYGAATDGGAGTLIASVDAKTAGTNQLADAIMIQWNKKYTEYTLISTDTTYAYYFVKFTDGTTDSSASDYVLATGLVYNSVENVIKEALLRVNAKIDPEADGLITRDWLLSVANDFQDEVINYEVTTPDGRKISKDWSWETFEDETSIALTLNENKYSLSGLANTLKYDNSKTGILSVRIGSSIIDYQDINEYEDYMEGKIRTEVKTLASAGDVTLVCDDTYEFSEEGTIYAGAETITYTGNTEATGTFTGIPAAGTGSITDTINVGSVVWQGITPGTPTKYTIFNGYLLLNNPPNSDLVGYKIKIKGIKRVSRLTDLPDTFDVPFTHLAKIYIASQIEYRKNNTQNGDRLNAEFTRKLNDLALKDKIQKMESLTYYRFGEDENNLF
jgi:hypothetical protein